MGNRDAKYGMSETVRCRHFWGGISVDNVFIQELFTSAEVWKRLDLSRALFKRP